MAKHDKNEGKKLRSASEETKPAVSSAPGSAAAMAELIASFPVCVEHGIWTAVPTPPPASVAEFTKNRVALERFTLDLRDVDPRQNDLIHKTGVMTFHMLGCSGSYDDHNVGREIAEQMAGQITNPLLGSINTHAQASSFLYHLGDVAYKPDVKEKFDFGDMINEQFYRQYTGYNRPIFAVAGNHDGKNPISPEGAAEPHRSAIQHFLANFCDPKGRKSADNVTDNRHAMTQPYVYWRLDTPLAQFIGLYANVANGGLLDDPHAPNGEAPQYDWLVAQLKAAGNKRKADVLSGTARKALIITIHYPPFSGGTNFKERGDPKLGPTLATKAVPLGVTILKAFDEAGVYPDIVFCAHAHMYQRLVYHYKNGRSIPYVIAGGGGHTIESLVAPCNVTDDHPAPPSTEGSKDAAFAAVFPPGFTLPAGDTIEGANYNDRKFGFLRVTIRGGEIIGEYFVLVNGEPKRFETFDVSFK